MPNNRDSTPSHALDNVTEGTSPAEGLPDGSASMSRLGAAEKSLRIKLQQRENLFKRIQVAQASSSDTHVSVTQLEAKLALLNRYLDMFEALQDQIEELSEEELMNDSRMLFEESYIAAKTRLSNQMLAVQGTDFQRDFNSTQLIPEQIARQRFKLPKLQLPKFSGEQCEWLEFYNTFVSIIHDNAELTAIEKFQYLRSCLTDNAARVIQSLEVTSKNYDKAIELLTARYNNCRFIFQSHLHQICEAKKLSNSSVVTMRTLIDTVNANLRAMQSIAASKTQIAEAIFLHIITKKLDNETQIKWEEEVATTWDSATAASSSISSLPTWEDLAAFLERQCQMSEIIDAQRSGTGAGAPSSSQSSSAEKNRPNHQRSAFVVNAETRCNLCEDTSHNAFKCSKFLEMQQGDRFRLVKANNLCFNCLGTGHRVTACPSAHRCQVCMSNHHTLLHYDTQPDSAGLQESDARSGVTAATLQASQACSEVIIATAVVHAQHLNGRTTTARALLDSASQLHFITEKLAQRLRLPRKETELNITGIGMSSIKTHQTTTLKFCSIHSSYSTVIEAVIVPSITSYQPPNFIHIDQWQLPQNIQLADKAFNVPGPVDILLGTNIFFELLAVGQIKIKNASAISQNTALGWIVSSATGAAQPAASTGITSTLPETSDRIYTLERHAREQEIKLETLEQHVLRQKLASAEEESYQRMLELQTDLIKLKDKVQAQDKVIRQVETEKTILIDELKQQNTHLANQIREAHATETKLLSQLHELKDQHNYISPILPEEVNIADSIQTEPNTTAGNSHELERRVHQSQEDKETSASALEEASLRGITQTNRKPISQLGQRHLAWNESSPQEQHSRRQHLSNQFKSIKLLKFQRFVPLKIETNIHTLADANSHAYGPCNYVVTKTHESLQSSLLVAKFRFASTKQITLPRLELYAVVLLVGLLTVLLKTIDIYASNVWHCSDSEITHTWIQGESAHWTKFIDNRVSKIASTGSKTQWHHVPTQLNPADIISRGTDVTEFADNSMWAKDLTSFDNHKTIGRPILCKLSRRCVTSVNPPFHALLIHPQKK